MDLDYREFFGNFVDEEYVNMVDEEALDLAWDYSEKGGSPKICIAVGLLESENIGWSLEVVADELDVTTRGIYNARDDLDLIEYEKRGKHLQ